MNELYNKSPLPLGGAGGRLRVGIFGAAGYTGGELIRLLLHHPEAEIAFAHSESNAGNLVSEVHEGLIGESDLRFCSDYDFSQVDVIFLCFGHGKSETFLKEHAVPAHVKIIDLAQDYRIRGDHDFVYGLPEINRAAISKATRVANPGCFATAIQLALLPALHSGIISGDIHVSTGAGQKPGATTHFSWRNDNVSVYKTFNHQHLLEINQTLRELQPAYDGRVLFIPQRGCFARGIFVTAYAKSDAPIGTIRRIYSDYYRDSAFTFISDKSPDLKQVVNTNKAVVYIEIFENQLLMVSCIDNLLKGAVGQAVQNMNLMCGLDERTGLNLKASAF